MIYLGYIFGTLFIVILLIRLFGLYKKAFLIKGTQTTDLLNTITNQLKEAALANTITIEVAEKLATQDRAQTKILEVLIKRLDVKLTEGAESLDRIETEASNVATDLANSHERAFKTTGPPGSQADAALSSIVKK